MTHPMHGRLPGSMRTRHEPSDLIEGNLPSPYARSQMQGIETFMPRKRGDDCIQELRWLHDRRNLEEAKADLAAWLVRWQARHPKLTAWVEENIEETLSHFRLPQQHHKNMKSTNMLERVNQEIKRRTNIVRVFPNDRSCLRLVRALAIEFHGNWLGANCCLNMVHLKEHRRERLRKAA